MRPEREAKVDEGMVPAERWAKTAVHEASTYSCGRCGKRFDSPHAVYEHLDAVHPKKGRKAGRP